MSVVQAARNVRGDLVARMNVPGVAIAQGFADFAQGRQLRRRAFACFGTRQALDMQDQVLSQRLCYMTVPEQLKRRRLLMVHL